jgi:excisionase family DNA binding protein
MSLPLAQALLAELDDAALDELAARLAPRLWQPAPATPALLTTDQVAEHVGCHPRTVARAIAARQLNAIKLAGRWRITPTALDAWLDHATDTPRRRAPRRSRSTHSLKEALA